MSNRNNIKLVATDIDGVWTDAKMHYTENGDFMKSFSTYDGMAVQILRENNIETVIITSEKSEIVLQRAKKLKISNIEMENAGLYAFGKILKHEVLSLSTVLANRALGTFSQTPLKSIDKMIQFTLNKIANMK